MSLSIKVGGVWKDAASLHTKVTGSWKTVSSVWVKISGVWEQVYSALSAVLSGGPFNEEAATNFPADITVGILASLTITGTAPFTYFWEYSGDLVDTGSPTASTFQISLTGRTPTTRSGSVWCTISDSFGNIITTAASPWSLTLT